MQILSPRGFAGLLASVITDRCECEKPDPNMDIVDHNRQLVACNTCLGMIPIERIREADDGNTDT